MKRYYGNYASLLLGIVLLIVCSTLISWGENSGSPSSSPNVSFAQPDYAAWRKIKEGMTDLEVITLLGKPLNKIDPKWRNDPQLNYAYSFGFVVPTSLAFPQPLSFDIRFQRGLVTFIEDPFDGEFSADGKPTRPRLLGPVETATYNHYPRLIDFRWYPSSGQYPMHYEIEVRSLGNREMFDNAADPRDDPGEIFTSDIPYFAHNASGMGRHRWRVRAINELGTSHWSEWRDFIFLR